MSLSVEKSARQSSGGRRGSPKNLISRVKAFFSRLFYIIGIVWKTSPKILISMCVLCILDGLIPVIGAYISRDLLNGVADLISSGVVKGSDVISNIFDTLAPLIFLFAAQIVYLFLKRVLGKINTCVTAIAGELVVNYIRLKIMHKAREVDQRSFDDPAFYERLENATREAGMRPIHILSATFKVISGFISVLSFIVVLAMLSPIAPVIIILASIPGAVVNYYYRNRNFKYLRRHSKERREMNYYSSLVTNKDMVKEIKMLGLSDTLEDKYKKSFKKYYGGLRKIILRECLMQVIVSLVYVLASGLLFVWVAYNVVFDGGEIGDWSLYTNALTSITTYVGTIVTSTATIYEGTLFIENMLDFMKEKVEIAPTLDAPRVPNRNTSHVIEFKNVSFKYPGCKEKVIKNVNLRLQTDESVVLVGLNGAGKTTLLKLLMRLYDPTEGVITLDGYDIREYDVRDLYDMYGIIFQDFGKYADTVSENIRFGDVRAENDGEKIKKSALDANADEFISALPKSYETPLTRMFEEDGIELSGGQWQKLSIARAFYKNSDILIMDEPTASLDPLAEQDVFNRFEELSKGKISIFVSHRLGSAVTAGKIIVLDGGEIKEMGTHEELMELHGIYTHLFTTQRDRYISEKDLGV
ncbi:MAG: ABC transporter ATP-binding protein [Ruminococcaceae bacterium]|nr:ABC transporter ATP-binding protein [Oscillospiraceae bacterium]